MFCSLSERDASIINPETLIFKQSFEERMNHFYIHFKNFERKKTFEHISTKGPQNSDKLSIGAKQEKRKEDDRIYRQ